MALRSRLSISSDLTEIGPYAFNATDTFASIEALGWVEEATRVRKHRQDSPSPAHELRCPPGLFLGDPIDFNKARRQRVSVSHVGPSVLSRKARMEPFAA
jgi:hypothetical protein